MTHTATFTPQAWINDYAVTVDAQGPTEWQVSEPYLAELSRQGFTLAEIMDPDTYPSDEVRHDPAAPEWIREWDGPFFITVHED